MTFGFTWSQLQERIGFPLIYAKLWGSRSHNTELPDSDWDYLAVYQVPTRNLLSLSATLPRPETVDGKGPDFEAHEVGKFCELLLKGGPAVLEMLFTDRHHFVGASLSWNELLNHREQFITQRAVTQYLGYARGQLARLDSDRPLHTKGGSYNTKWAYHIVRLVQDAKRLAQGKPPVVWREGPEREYLMQVREGKVPRQEIVAMLEDALYDPSLQKPVDIPTEGPREWLNEWLLDLRGVE